MKRFAGMAIVFALLVAALVAVERKNVAAAINAEPLLYLVADSERDLTRMPSRFARIPDAEEAKYGNALAAQILAGRTMSGADNAVETVLIEIGEHINPYAHRRLKMHVHYLSDPGLVNAFAIPGGHIFIGRGLLRQMTTADQVASVIGHEMEHVDHYHCAERLQVEAALRKIPLGFIAQIPIAVFQAGYSKEQELEADRDGVLLAAKAGYSAQGAVDMFQMLARMEGQPIAAATPQEELASVTGGAMTGYFRSHPLAQDRIAQVNRMIASEPQLRAHPQRPLEITTLLR